MLGPRLVRVHIVWKQIKRGLEEEIISVHEFKTIGNNLCPQKLI